MLSWGWQQTTTSATIAELAVLVSRGMTLKILAKMGPGNIVDYGTEGYRKSVHHFTNERKWAESGSQRLWLLDEHLPWPEVFSFPAVPTDCSQGEDPCPVERERSSERVCGSFQ